VSARFSAQCLKTITVFDSNAIDMGSTARGSDFSEFTLKMLAGSSIYVS
jgi:hypothetical protein